VNSIGCSHESYNYNTHQWALAIDAAAPAASYRPDLFYEHKRNIPSTWAELINLAKEGRVAAPAIPIDLLMNFYMFCIAHGREPFITKQEVIKESTGLKALQSMRELYTLIDKEMFNRNPIAVAELMSSTDEYWYCPFAYCYSNYSREGYAKNVLHYTDLVEMNHNKLRSTIGGTGLAISAFSREKEAALLFAQMVVSAKHQSTFYVQHGGQPGHAAAWSNVSANQLTNNFFTGVRPAIDRGYVRPRYNGYLHFQDHAGDPLHDYLMNNGDALKVLNKMNQVYKESLRISKSNLVYE
jgi:multiple sugar transport system substrate-binding protein